MFFIRDEVHSLDIQDYSIAAGGEALSVEYQHLSRMCRAVVFPY